MIAAALDRALDAEHGAGAPCGAGLAPCQLGSQPGVTPD
jgi:hypothetical protein